MAEPKSYYAIIPATVRYDRELPPNAKLLYGEITALCNETGYCWATNAYFSELYGVSERAISRWLNALTKNGHIVVEMQKRNGGTEECRSITLLVGGWTKLSTPLDKIVYPPTTKLSAEKVSNLSYLNNNTINNIYNVVFRIFDHWNSKKIIKHQELKDPIKQAIERALKKYSEAEIATYIDRYAELLQDKGYFWHYKWTLYDFLTRREGISSFTDEGSKWLNYCEYVQKKGGRHATDDGSTQNGKYDGLDLGTTFY